MPFKIAKLVFHTASFYFGTGLTNWHLASKTFRRHRKQLRHQTDHKLRKVCHEPLVNLVHLNAYYKIN